MKATGVVRRIDELGRIVIPKELRRTLNIKEGEQLEIYLEKENIVLKKFSNLEQLSDLAGIIIDIISNIFNKNILVTDREKVIGVSSKSKDEYMLKKISPYLENIMTQRKRVVENNFLEVSFVENTSENLSFVIYPIIVNSDVMGIVSIFSDKKRSDEFDEKIAELVVKFFGKIIDV